MYFTCSITISSKAKFSQLPGLLSIIFEIKQIALFFSFSYPTRRYFERDFRFSR